MLNIHISKVTRENKSKVKQDKGVGVCAPEGDSVWLQDKWWAAAWTSSIKPIKCRYLAKDSYFLESSRQLMGGFCHWRDVGSRIIHPSWCGCWWISIIMPLLTQGSVSISWSAQTVTGEICFLSRPCHMWFSYCQLLVHCCKAFNLARQR